MHIYVYIYIHTYIHTRTHTHTRRVTQIIRRVPPGSQARRPRKNKSIVTTCLHTTDTYPGRLSSASAVDASSLRTCTFPQ